MKAGTVPAVPRPLRVGVQLPEVERVVRWPEYRAMAGAVEELGFDSIWLGDHLLYRNEGEADKGPWDVWTLLGALAAITDRVQLGPLVACTGFHPPGMIARMAAAIDEISGGRFVLGLGCGWNRGEFAAFGIPYDHRVARFEEAHEIIRRLVAGEHATLDGTYWQAADAVVLPPPARRIPLMIGSNGPRMLGIALPHADAWNTWWDGYGNSVAGFAELNARIDAAAESAGRAPKDIDRSACVLVTVDRRAGDAAAGGGGPARGRSRDARGAPAGPRGRRRGRGDPRPRSDHRGVDQGGRAGARIARGVEPSPFCSRKPLNWAIWSGFANADPMGVQGFPSSPSGR
jgi:alkanesulfonate monooxygenase SsuD/methylene tetrahydromethanopterin reductase-like flavin-dependent oxidoreductase (luciferase family)